MGMNDKHDYEPTKWVDNSEPDIDAEHLNKIESALQEYGASIDELAATGGTAAKVKATDTYGLVVDALGESTAQALIDAIANKVVNELINKNKIVNNLLATDASTVLAGTQGAALDKRLVAAENAVTQLNSDLDFSLKIEDTILVSKTFPVGLTTIEVAGKMAPTPSGYQRIASILYVTQNYLIAQLAFIANSQSIYVTVQNFNTADLYADVRCVQIYKKIK